MWFGAYRVTMGAANEPITNTVSTMTASAPSGRLTMRQNARLLLGRAPASSSVTEVPSPSAMLLMTPPPP